MLPQNTRRPPRAGRGLALALTLVGVVAVTYGCRDELTRPPARPLSVADPAAPPPFAITDTVAGDLSGDYVAPIIDPIWVKGSTAIGTSSANLLYKITVKGKLERTAIYSGPTEGVPYTAYGARACKGGVDVVTNWTTNVWANWCLGEGELGEYTRFQRLTGPTKLYRSQADQVYGCTPTHDQYCYSFHDAEPMTAIIRRVPGKIVVRPGFAAAKYNTSVQFTLDIVAVNQIDSAATAGIIPFTSTSWTFTPDTGAVQTWSCNTYCDRTLTKSGWLEVKSTVNGEPKDTSVRVKVFLDAAVTADSASVYPGSSITFTTRLDGEEAPGQDWKWSGIPVDTAANCTAGSTTTTCRRTMVAPGSGVMEAKVRLADGSLEQARGASVSVKRRELLMMPDFVSVVAGGAATFAASVNPTGGTIQNVVWTFAPDSGQASTGLCTGVMQCTISPTMSGWMEVTATVDHEVQRKRARVLVSVCPTKDRYLDDPMMRDTIDALTSRMNKSTPVTARQEEGGTIYYNRDTGAIRVTHGTSIGGPCSFRQDTLAWDSTATWVPVAYWHTHPYWKGESVQHCSNKPAQPFDPADGLSEGDWGGVNCPSCRLDSYVITPEMWLAGRWYPPGQKKLDKYARKSCSVK